MQGSTHPPLSVAGLVAEREARRKHEIEAHEKLVHKEAEDLQAFKKRLDEFQMTDEFAQALDQRIRRAFENKEPELMLVSFPSSFCSDGGRAIENIGEPPINKPDAQEAKKHPEPAWLDTLPRGARSFYNYWKSNLQPGNFGLSARIISFPGGMPGDVGLFVTWPRSALED